jgi:hypothetical protein
VAGFFILKQLIFILRRRMKKHIKIFLSGFLFITIFSGKISFFPEEGMYPLSEIHKLNLNEAGLKISVDEVYNPDGVSIIDGLVKVGGCSGSFVSNEGLIITNHHCVFSSVQKASTLEKNYLENGFLAKTGEEEIIAEGLICRITESYEDVSDEILKAAEEANDLTERSELIKKKIKEIVKKEEKDSTIKAEVSEMFTGQSYVLFRYKIINDVRLVYVPPRNIGEFGGETDNWIWPRHTGDFSFVRAYVAPDGTPAKYSPENIPFKPKRFIKVNPSGVEEGDFIFVMGYPARTFKNYPSDYLVYQYKYLLPYLSELYRWMINLYEEKGDNDPEFALNISSQIKSLANAEKNYKSKLQGIKRLNLIEKKKEEDKQLDEFIESDEEQQEKYGGVTERINEIYSDLYQSGRIPLMFSVISRYSVAYRLAEILVEKKFELAKPEEERKTIYTENGKASLKKTINNLFYNFYPEVDKKIFIKILSDASEFSEVKGINLFDKTDKDYLNEVYEETALLDESKYREFMKYSKDELESFEDPLFEFVSELTEVNKQEKERSDLRESNLNLLLPKYMEAKRLWLSKDFVPDANSTLRLTYGYIKGYSPADATYYYPVSTLSGVIEKGKESGDYKINMKLVEVYQKGDLGRFKDEKLNDVPVAILYNTDTSGGNSGSPVLDAYGQLVGVNFDRAYESTINDFTWNPFYSRSIGVDIRYVLFVIEKIGEADFLLEEMGIGIME